MAEIVDLLRFSGLMDGFIDEEGVDAAEADCSGTVWVTVLVAVVAGR